MFANVSAPVSDKHKVHVRVFDPPTADPPHCIFITRTRLSGTPAAQHESSRTGEPWSRTVQQGRSDETEGGDELETGESGGGYRDVNEWSHQREENQAGAAED